MPHFPVSQVIALSCATIPFCLVAVGQVQDVGLIFLSAMATSIAGICLEAGRDAATALGTSLLTMSVATFFTGACTLLVGAWVGFEAPSWEQRCCGGGCMVARLHCISLHVSRTTGRRCPPMRLFHETWMSPKLPPWCSPVQAGAAGAVPAPARHWRLPVLRWLLLCGQRHWAGRQPRHRLHLQVCVCCCGTSNVQWPPACLHEGSLCLCSALGRHTSASVAMSTAAHPPSPHISPPPHLRRSWANLFNSDALTKLVPTLLSCFAMIATLEHFSHPLALPTGAAGAECSWQCCNPTTRLCSAGRNPGHGHM